MTNPNYTHLALIVDRSGSMSPIARDMDGSIKTLLAEQAKLPGEIHVDVTTFDAEIEHVYSNVRPDDIKHDLIVPRGRTALNDAIGSTIAALGQQFAELNEDDRPGNVIVVIVTDGMENASREYTLEQVKAMVETQTNDYGWTFLFFGANSMGDVVDVAAGYGVNRAHTMSYGHDAAGTQVVGSTASNFVTRTRSGLDTSGGLDGDAA
jgi:hypothetical protein